MEPAKNVQVHLPQMLVAQMERTAECAAAGKSDYIVTGDAKHMLPLGSYAGIPISRVAEFLRKLEEGRQR